MKDCFLLNIYTIYEQSFENWLLSQAKDNLKNANLLKLFPSPKFSYFYEWTSLFKKCLYFILEKTYSNHITNTELGLDLNDDTFRQHIFRKTGLKSMKFFNIRPVILWKQANEETSN